MLVKGPVTSTARQGPRAGRGPTSQPSSYPLATLGPVTHTHRLFPHLSDKQLRASAPVAKKANFGNIPISTGRRMYLVTHFSEWHHQQIQPSSQSSPDTTYSLIPVTEDTGLKPSILIQFSLYLAMFIYHRLWVSLQWVNQELRLKLEIHLRNSPTKSPTSLVINTYRVDGRIGIDLQHVNVVRGILEESIIRIQHLMAQ